MSVVKFIKISPDAKIPQRANPTDAGMDLCSAEDIVVPPNGGRVLVSTGLKIGISPDKVKSVIEIEDGSFQENYITNEDIVGSIEHLSDCISNKGVVDYVWQAEVRPRSGLAAKNGVTVLNSPGTIDSAYRGEIKVIIVNNEVHPFEIKKGDRIAQLVITKSYILPIEEVEDFSDKTFRGEGGFGSSGTR